MARESFPPVDEQAQIDQDILANDLIIARAKTEPPRPAQRGIFTEAPNQDELDNRRVVAAAEKPFVRAPKLTGDELTDDIRYARLSTARINLLKPLDDVKPANKDTALSAGTSANPEVPVNPELIDTSVQPKDSETKELETIGVQSTAEQTGTTNEDDGVLQLASNLLWLHLKDKHKLTQLRDRLDGLHADSGSSNTEEPMDQLASVVQALAPETDQDVPEGLDEQAVAADGLAVVVDLLHRDPKLVDSLRAALARSERDYDELTDRIPSAA